LVLLFSVFLCNLLPTGLWIIDPNPFPDGSQHTELATEKPETPLDYEQYF
jgi:hypothetical protein